MTRRRHVLRKPVLAAVTVVFLAIGELGLLGGLSSYPFGALSILFLALIAFLAVLMWRVCVVGVVLDHSGVTVRNYLRNIRLTWSQIAAIEPPRGRGITETGVRLILADGRVVRRTGLQPGNAEPLDASHRFVETLRHELQKRR